MRRPHDWTHARSREAVARDRATILAMFEDMDHAAAVWAALDDLSRWPEASRFIRNRAATAAAALGVILDHAIDTALPTTGDRE